MEPFKAVLAIKKETKNTVHYKSETPADHHVTDLYIKKSKLSTPYPLEIEVSVRVPGTTFPITDGT